MPGWRRNKGGAPAASPAVQPPARSRDDWRTLPPLPTVLRSPVTTLATSAFSDNLSTWRNPSFLSPLSHRIDPDGPAGLISGMATAPASPESLTYYHDRPLSPPADGRAASLQRSVASWSPPPATRSWLVTAPDVELDPVTPPVVSARSGEAGSPTEAEADDGQRGHRHREEPGTGSADPTRRPAGYFPASGTAPPGRSQDYQRHGTAAGAADVAETAAGPRRAAERPTRRLPGSSRNGC